jgi:hypothetical protein
VIAQAVGHGSFGWSELDGPELNGRAEPTTDLLVRIVTNAIERILTESLQFDRSNVLCSVQIERMRRSTNERRQHARTVHHSTGSTRDRTWRERKARSRVSSQVVPANGRGEEHSVGRDERSGEADARTFRGSAWVERLARTPRGWGRKLPRPFACHERNERTFAQTNDRLPPPATPRRRFSAPRWPGPERSEQDAYFAST